MQVDAELEKSSSTTDMVLSVIDSTVSACSLLEVPSPRSFNSSLIKDTSSDDEFRIEIEKVDEGEMCEQSVLFAARFPQADRHKPEPFVQCKRRCSDEDVANQTAKLVRMAGCSEQAVEKMKDKLIHELYQHAEEVSQIHQDFNKKEQNTPTFKFNLTKYGKNCNSYLDSTI